MKRGSFAVGLVLKLVLDRLGVRRDPVVVPGASTPAGERPPRGDAAEAKRAEPSVRRRPLMLFMFGSLAIGMGLMLVFEHWTTRVVGVLACVAFIVSGVFLIADPAFLAAEDHDEG